MVIHPNCALKIAFLLLNLLWCNFKNIAMEIVLLLLALVGDLVVGKFVGAKRELKAALDIGFVFGG